MYSFHKCLVPFSSTITLPDTPFSQFDPIIPHLSFTIGFAIQKISFWCSESFKSLAHSFCFFSFAEEITLFALCLLLLHSFHASVEFFSLPFSVLHLLFPYCFSNLLIPTPCFLMSARIFLHSTYVLCCFHHYLFHLLPVFTYIQVFPLFFHNLISILTCLFLLKLPYTYSSLKLLMPSFCSIKPHVHY